MRNRVSAADRHSLYPRTLHYLGRHRSWALFSRGMLFLFHFSDRHTKFWNIVAFPLAPIGFAQACQHLATFVLDSHHQVVFFCLIGRAFEKHPDRLVGTFGDEDRVAGFDVDGLPRFVQIQAEGFLHRILSLTKGASNNRNSERRMRLVPDGSESSSRPSLGDMRLELPSAK